MSLFQFGFRRTRTVSQTNQSQSGATLATHMPSHEDSGLGRTEYEECISQVSELSDPNPPKKRKLRGTYAVYTPADRARIGKYAVENGNKNARLHFLKDFPSLNESTVRNFKKSYVEKMNQQTRQLNPQPVTEIPIQSRGRPPYMLELDNKLIKFLLAVRNRGGIINIHVVRASAKALIATNPDQQQLARFNMPRSWVYSLYRRMGLSRRMGTTSRPPVPRGLYEECKKQYLGDILDIKTKYNIPAELILNSDQTPSSYVSVGNKTMAARGSKSVPIKGLTDKRNITLNFVISLSGEFLPVQIIYGGKTKASLPRGVEFPSQFSVTQNPKHWSNELETITLIDKIVNPYVVAKRSELKLPATQKALMIWDVFKGQMTDKVKDKLKELNIELVSVPANMTHFFQPLDLTVNGSAKKFMQNQFSKFYCNAVKAQIDSGKQVDEIDIDFRLTTLKPLHAQWIISLYDHFTSERGSQIIKKGWERSGITEIINGSVALPSADPFTEL